MKTFDLKHFRKEKKISQVKLADALGIGQSFISQIENGKDPMPEPLIEKIKDLYNISDISRYLNDDLQEDLQTDETEDGGPFSTGKLIPLFDADAAAGLSYGMNMEPARQIEMIQIGGFLRESEAALRVYGNSMIPHYPPGCIIGTREWRERFIEPGQVYLIETRENRFIKRLMYNKDKTAFRCLSDNTMRFDSGPATGEFCYPEFEILVEDVSRIHRVIGVIKRNII